MDSQEPLDEIQWRAPDLAQQLGGIHENTVLFYFAKSPFFDPTSNNATLETQALHNPSMTHILETRVQFEGHLETMQGLEFIVAHSARDYGQDAEVGQGTWVIRKQNRRKIQGAEDQLEILANYFVIGENIYQAPSIESVLSSKLQSISLALNNFYRVAARVGYYTPALGSHYLPAPVPSLETPANSQSQRSKENTPMPESQSQGESSKAGAARSTASTASTSTSATAAQLFTEAMEMYLRYGHEFMDENPLIGEPGSFVISSSKQTLQQQAAQRAQQQQQAKSQSALKPQPEVVQSDANNDAKSPSGEAAALQLKNELEASKQAGKSGDKAASPTSAVPKPKRRKSKAPNSPSTPVDASSPG